MSASTRSSATPFNDVYISPHDEAELARLKTHAGMQGLGEVLNLEDNDDLSDVLSDFGYNSVPPEFDGK